MSRELSPVPLAAFRQRPRRAHSCVYIIRETQGGAFKVGHAVDPRARFLRMLRDRPDLDLELYAIGRMPNPDEAFRGAYGVETHLHLALSRHKAKTTGRDWFQADALQGAVELLHSHATPVPPQQVLFLELNPDGCAS